MAYILTEQFDQTSHGSKRFRPSKKDFLAFFKELPHNRPSREIFLKYWRALPYQTISEAELVLVLINIRGYAQDTKTQNIRKDLVAELQQIWPDVEQRMADILETASPRSIGNVLGIIAQLGFAPSDSLSFPSC